MDAYVGFNLRVSPEMNRWRADACECYDLIPRLEYHLTLARLGAVSRPILEHLATRIHLLARSLPKSLSFAIQGVGGCAMSNGSVCFISEETDASWIGRPRVAWWSLKRSSMLEDLRESVIRQALSAGLPITCTDYSPHVTLGSNGPHGTAAQSIDWDVHSILKMTTVPRFGHPAFVAAERLHISSSRVHPGSHFLLRQWRQS